LRALSKILNEESFAVWLGQILTFFGVRMYVCIYVCMYVFLCVSCMYMCEM
jgi:hypothetical protein